MCGSTVVGSSTEMGSSGGMDCESTLLGSPDFVLFLQSTFCSVLV